MTAPNDAAAPPADPPPPTPEAPTPAPPQGDPPSDDKGTDWKAEARKWEDRAKANAAAAKERDALLASQMTEQERAVAEAKAEGEKTAAQTYGRRLAAAHFEAAVARAGLDLGEAGDLIDVAKFVDDAGEVDDKAIKAAVAKLAKVTAKTPGRSGGDHPGGSAGSGATRPASLEDAVSARYAQ